MKDIYSLSDPLQAHLIAHRLEQEGIKSWINGEQLVSAAGGIPMLQGMIRISVVDEDFVRAREILLRIENEGRPSPVRAYQGPRPRTVVAAVVGAVALMAAVLFLNDTGLLDRGSGAAKADARALTPLMIAAARGDLAAAQRLIAGGADVNAADKAGLTALMGAAARGDAAMCRFLLDRGAAVNAKEAHGDTALTLVGIMGQTEVMNVLIDHGAAIEQRDNKGLTPLMALAAAGAKPEAVELLLRRGANPAATAPDGRTPDQIARQSPRGNLASILLLEQAKEKRRKQK